jgi:hypothetical protein
MLRNLFQINILFILLMGLSSPVVGQNLDKKIDINLAQVDLDSLIKHLGSKHELSFSYNSNYLKGKGVKNYIFKNTPIKQILKEVLSPFKLEHQIISNTIVILPRKKPKKDAGTEEHIISGYIKEVESGEILIGATIYFPEIEKGTVSNAYGFYSIKIPNDSYYMEISHVGHRRKAFEIKLVKDVVLDIDLSLEIFEVETVIVKENKELNRINSSQMSELNISPQDLGSMPKFAGDLDIVKSLNTVPGINTFGDGSTLFYVRGGQSDQNLIILDDAPLYNTSHLFGFFSAISPNSIKEVTIYKGDAPADKGGRLSSVVEIRTKDGNMKHLSFAGNLSPLVSSLSIEAPIIKDKASFFLSGRRSNMNWLFRAATSNENLDLSFSDFNAKFNAKLNNKNRIYFSVYNGMDDFGRLGQYTSNSFGITWNNQTFSSRWTHIVNSKTFMNTTVFYSKYQYSLFLSREENNYWGSEISTFGLKTDIAHYAKPGRDLKSGFALTAYGIDPGNLYFSNVEIQNIIPQASSYKSRSLTWYFSGKEELTPSISLNYGLRLPLWWNVGETELYHFDSNYEYIGSEKIPEGERYYTALRPEPKINLSFRLNTFNSIKLGYNRSAQFLQVVSNSTSPFTTLEAFVPSGPNIKPQLADQLGLGFFHTSKEGRYSFSIESFYRKYHNQIDYKDLADLLYNPYLEGELRFGSAESYGAELLLKKSKGNLNGWIAYTYSRAFKTITGINDNKAFPAFYDRPHDFSVNINWDRGKRWAYTVNYVYLSGGAITTPIGFYKQNGYVVPVYGDKNNDRLPDYQRLDFTVSLRLNKPTSKFKHEILLSIYNLTGRSNPFSVNFNKMVNDQGNYVVPTDFSEELLVEPTVVSVAGIIPSINYKFSFR